MGKSEQQLRTELDTAANNLHHLSMRYVGALAEVAAGKRMGFLAKDHPGLKECRDLIDLVLLTRAEISAILRLLVDKKLITVREWTEQCVDDYKYLAEVKAKQLNVTIHPHGLVFTVEPMPPQPPEHPNPKGN